MAMLAETKRRQKLSSDPRNNAWSNDTNKFGQQLMEKMGWKQGKGLGVNEDGKTSHISVCLKNNTLGLGCSQERNDNWISHQDDFNDLLNSLNQNHHITDEKKSAGSPQSLQEKSKKAKKRVHYKKFTAGKDLSTYDDHAMNCIMGVRHSSNTPQNQSETTSDDEARTGDCGRVGLGFSSSNKHGVSHEDEGFGVETFTSSNSMQEYFAKKMKAIHEKRNTCSASEMRVELEGTGEVDDTPTALSNNTDQNTHQKKKKKSKRKHKNKKIEQYTEEDNDSQGEAMDQHDNDFKDNGKEVNLNSGIKTDIKKKKKRRKVEDVTAVDCDEDILNNESSNDNKVEKEGSRKKKKSTGKKDKKRKSLQR